MIEVPLISFVDFVVASGTARLTKVRQIKGQLEDPYSPQRDFYKGIREGIVEFHRDDLGANHLQMVIDRADRRKHDHYRDIVRGYKRFLKRTEGVRAIRTKADWVYGDLTVVVNPELRMNLKGVPYWVKLYFKKQELTLRRVDVALHLMSRSLRPKRAVVALLDTRRAKLFRRDEPPPVDLDPLLQGEAAALREMWRGL